VFGFEGEMQLLLLGRSAVDLLLGLGAVLSLLVSVHVLLNKREVGTAIGWMGLVWFSPFVGSLFYVLFGVNRVTRRARERRQYGSAAPAQAAAGGLPARNSHFAPLERAGGRITERPVLGGNAVTALHCGDEAYPAMLAAIGVARRSIALATYILRNDRIGGTFIDALIAARRRGVQVRVLIDGIGGGYFHSAAASRLRRAGVPVGRFMHSPLPWRMPFLNLRSHQKILLVDGTVGFTGGINIGGENVLADRPRRPVRDTHFRLQGPVVGQLAEAFVRDWAFVTGEDLAGEEWLSLPTEAGSANARVITSGPDSDEQKIEFLLLEAIACARHSIRIATPYFLPDERLVTALALASLRGVQVDIVLPKRSNHVLIEWALRAHALPLLRHGCRIWLSPPPFNHSKLMTIDGEWCLIGSANWDARSFRLNFELTVEIYHAELAARIRQMIDADNCQPLTEAILAARALPIRLRDALARLLLPYL
jgi:cardiolipin synthase